jgi:hypothetical protein
MAEGYRADQINDFVTYANAGFATTASIHFNQTNDFFDRYYTDLNIVRYDTISPESGVDTVAGKDYVKSILDYNYNSGTADMDRIKAVVDKSNQSGNCELKLKNVDAVVILVNNYNNPEYFAYTWSFDDQILHNKNAEPVHYVVVSAPEGFPGDVATNAIAHELGHAMGSLSDEYTKHNDSSKTCNAWMKPWARNITNDFFGSPITSEERWDGIMADYANAVNYPVKYVPGGNYCDHDFYRPTADSSMRFWEHSDGFVGVPQFGPVNTYYMYGTYRNRINSSNSTRHKWPDYYSTFKTAWPIGDF